VNNAGVGGGGSMSQTTEEDFDHLFATNVKGPFFVSQQAIPRLREGGRVINIGSVAARGAAAPRAAYSVSKLAIHGLTLSLAEELAPKQITVNVVAPGAVETDLIAESQKNPAFNQAVIAMTAFRRIGKPIDIAGAVLLLTQPEAGWITGQIIEVSGGLRM
jgi:3-oxoacyl-[acyl-carrier protein] reductase